MLHDADSNGKAVLLRDGGGGPEPEQLQGRAFCFLPLPLFTGLPVHINGLFEVTNNRRVPSWTVCAAGSCDSVQQLWERLMHQGRDC